MVSTFKIIFKIITILVAFDFYLIAQDDFSDDLESSGASSEVVNLSGTVTDAANRRSLAGANIIVDGTDLGIAADENGEFTIEGVEVGASVTASMIGYEDQVLYADKEMVEFTLTQLTIEMSELEVLASRAGENTAVAYTNITKEDLSLRLGSRDIPLAMNTVPSVYATGQGGGAGDSRINVRGFNQRNIAIMINGVPVNDMENGWVYWSNWDGLADATSSIQMQKGLSAQNLATPSIGGSMNIITDPSSQERRGSFKQEIGAFGFLKSTLSYHSGLMLDDRLALSGTVVRKIGEGHSDGTWTDAYAYYLDAAYNLNDAHRLQFYVLGAPQQHGQNSYRQNIGAYVAADSDFMKSLQDEGYGYNPDALAVNGGKYSYAGREFNQNTSEISEASQAILDAADGQHWKLYSERNGVKRHETGRLNERMNFFHKPQAALNHYWDIQENMRLTSSAYWSGGMGGGTGHYGSVDRDPRVEGNAWFASSPWTYNYNTTIADNVASSTGSNGILRNSNNRQSTIGLLSKFAYDINDNLSTEVGIDWRTAKIYHVKEIRDLLGGDYFVNTDSDFDADGTQKGIGDAIDYNFTNTVDWLGLLGQVQYKTNELSAYAMLGLTTVGYTMWDHFKKAENYDYSYVQEKDGGSADWVTGGGNPGELYIEADPITTAQVKGGVLYSFGDALSFMNEIPVLGKLYENTDVWFNFGLIDKAPTFDQVIQDWDARMATDPANEKFTAFELGLNLSSNDGTMAAKLNIFSTTWTDRVQTKTAQDQGDSTDDIIIYLSGINQSHTGVELEMAMQLHEMVRLDVATGFGNYIFTDDATGTYRDGGEEETYGYALKDLKVGDMPQTTLSLGTTITPLEGLTLQVMYRHYLNHTADWSPDSREYVDEVDADRLPSWLVPNYGVLDLHGTYNLPFELGPAKPRLFFHVFNVLDEVYVQDATDNSSYNSWDGNHNADDAEVFMGLPFRFNAGLSFTF